MWLSKSIEGEWVEGKKITEGRQNETQEENARLVKKKLGISGIGQTYTLSLSMGATLVYIVLH